MLGETLDRPGHGMGQSGTAQARVPAAFARTRLPYSIGCDTRIAVAGPRAEIATEALSGCMLVRCMQGSEAWGRHG